MSNNVLIIDTSVLLISLCIISSFIHASNAEIRTYNFTISYGFWSPDCVKKQIVLVNGIFPGPTIDVNEGDTLIVNVHNELETEGVSIHWHGLRQYGTVFMDGAAYVTECPIPSLETFRYKFVASKAGTYMYHSHHGLQVSEGLFGFLIVRESPGKFPYAYDEERLLFLSDWYHQSSREQTAGLNSIPFVFVGNAQSILINGKGKYNCSVFPSGTFIAGDVKSCNASNPQCSREVISVEPGKKYRLRIITLTQLHQLNLIIEGHEMEVIEADQHLVTPFNTTSIESYSGQNYDVLFTASEISDNYWISVKVRGRNAATPPGLAVLKVGNVVATDPSRPTPTHAAWNDTNYSFGQTTSYKSLSKSKGGDSPIVPRKSSRQIILVNAQNYHNGHIVWTLNNYTHELPSTPYLHAVKSGVKGLYDESTPKDGPDYVYDYRSPPPVLDSKKSSHVYFIKRDTIVDVILQNSNVISPNVSEYHPWHLHGAHFWVLGIGNGTFTSADTTNFNLKDPSYRNTIEILPYGWTAIRFKANNPGMWLFHCHIISHHHMGMAVVFGVGRKDGKNMPKLPRKTRKCGELF